MAAVYMYSVSDSTVVALAKNWQLFFQRFISMQLPSSGNFWLVRMKVLSVYTVQWWGPFWCVHACAATRLPSTIIQESPWLIDHYLVPQNLYDCNCAWTCVYWNCMNRDVTRLFCIYIVTCVLSGAEGLLTYTGAPNTDCTPVQLYIISYYSIYMYRSCSYCL